MLKFVPALALFAVAHVASANLLVNGSFEADDASASPYTVRYTGASNPTGWTQYNNGVDLIHNGYTQPPPVLVSAQDGQQWIDINADGLFGGLRQTVAATPGTTYELSLYASRWATNSAGSLVYSLIDPASNAVLATSTFSVDNTDGWQHLTLDGTAISGSIQVQIENAGDTYQAAPGLDNVSLVAVPEPASATLLAAPALVVLRRRR